jgi:ABC-type transporter Mla maintaining outer membrane lipid asymmetry ATPase subunit MlaF
MANTEKQFYKLENICIQDSNQTFGLSNFSMDVYLENNTLLLGPEGSGKGQLIELLTGFTNPEKGTFFIEDRSIKSFSQTAINEYRAKSIAYVSYSFGLLSNLSVYQNISLPLTFHTKLSQKEIAEVVTPQLEEFSLLEIKDHRPTKLNQNEKLRVSFLRSLQLKPKLMIFDHILSGQCPIAMRSFFKSAMQKLKEIKCGLFMSEFLFEPVIEYMDDVVLIYGGKKCFMGSVKDFYESNNEYAKQYSGRQAEGPMSKYFTASLKLPDE